jgi:hypothetical protein
MRRQVFLDRDQALETWRRRVWVDPEYQGTGGSRLAVDGVAAPTGQLDVLL